MEAMEKPNVEKRIVFLSHSSRDKATLSALKNLLDKRAAGALEFFLSSDGESIPFGRNWVVRVSDALKNAKLMFVFLTPESANSKWIHFETGNAYSQNIRVVPVCLPGMDLNQMSPPLSLLQGFNLHSHEAMGNLARTCNEVLDMKMDETFTPQHFTEVFLEFNSGIGSFFGAATSLIEHVRILMSVSRPGSDTTNLLKELGEMCSKQGTHYAFRKASGDQIIAVDLSGCEVMNSKVVAVGPASAPTAMITTITCTLSPSLFHINVSVLDNFYKELGTEIPIKVSIQLKDGIVVERQRYHLTSKLHGTGIQFLEAGEFKYETLAFRLSSPRAAVHLESSTEIPKQPLSDLLTKLIATEVFYEKEIEI